MFEEFVDKKVVIIKKDGYKKAGLVLSVDNGFIKLQKDSSDTPEYIAYTEIGSIGEAKT